MGCGAIFMIQRVKALDAHLISSGAVAETDPRLLDEMIALIVARGLTVVSLAEMRRRLLGGDLDSRFVCFTFDGAYRSIKDKVLPLFMSRNMPFAVFAASDYLGGGHVPWWLALEALLTGRDRVSLTLEGEPIEIRCRSKSEKQQAFGRLFQRLGKLAAEPRMALLESALKLHGIDRDALALREMLSAEEIKRLAQNELVTVGVQGGGLRPLASMSFEDARQDFEGAIQTLEAAAGERPRHLAFPNGEKMAFSARDVGIARELGFETAVTAIEGALWPEHARELLVLPRIALDNDPATLVRALMLGGESTAASPATRRTSR
jgi:peptidoglycan/xylan/chitin deacetylase (PgdA/CDA1 family)